MVTVIAALAAATLPVLIVWAGATDLLTGTIPNPVVLLLTACFAVFTLAAGLDRAQLFSHLLCACLVLTFGFVLFSQGWIGGGDAKLLAGAALWFGFEYILPFLAGVALAGGAMASLYLCVNIARDRLGLTAARLVTIPYGAAIAAGALAVFPHWQAAF
jgi:prepilin peptidase CpaA